MKGFTEIYTEQQKVRESLANQLELLSKASQTAYDGKQFDSLARLSEAMGMVANSYLVNYGLG